jgi:hypothetical protein
MSVFLTLDITTGHHQTEQTFLTNLYILEAAVSFLLHAISVAFSKQKVLICIYSLRWMVYLIHFIQPAKNNFSLAVSCKGET